MSFTDWQDFKSILHGALEGLVDLLVVMKFLIHIPPL
jgi:hypothetical protein